jgi:hypothetical protein
LGVFNKAVQVKPWPPPKTQKHMYSRTVFEKTRVFKNGF